MTRRWQLCEQVIGDTFVGLDVTVDADTWGRAVEALLPGEVCSAPVHRNALVLDFTLGDKPPDLMNLRTHRGVYRIVPVDDATAAAVTHDARRLVDRLRGEGIVP